MTVAPQTACPKLPLADLCRRISSGGTPSRRRPEYFVETGGHLWVKSQELLDRSVWTTSEHISDLGLANSSAKYFPVDTILLAMYGANVGQLGYLRAPATVNQAICGLCPDTRIADPRYVFYALMQGRGPLIRQAAGAAQQNLNQALIRNFRIPVPSLHAQRKVAGILSAYDDLIESNGRRIKLLEEMVQRIYQEWFVDFRYPGHENVAISDTTLGPVPRGWTWMRASEAMFINPKIFVERTVTRPFVPMTSISEEGMHIARLEARAGASGSRFVNGDTLFARITPCLENGKTAYVQCLLPGDVASGSTEYIVLRSHHLGPEFTYLLARDDRFRSHAIQSMSGATGRQRVREECFDNFWLATPPRALLDSFEGLVRPMFKLSYGLFRANGNLRAAHDLLLPRLVSGEIDVEDLDIAMAEAVA